MAFLPAPQKAQASLSLSPFTCHSTPQTAQVAYWFDTTGAVAVGESILVGWSINCIKTKKAAKRINPFAAYFSVLGYCFIV
jgi:hypothetical protein